MTKNRLAILFMTAFLTVFFSGAGYCTMPGASQAVPTNMKAKKDVQANFNYPLKVSFSISPTPTNYFDSVVSFNGGPALQPKEIWLEFSKDGQPFYSVGINRLTTFPKMIEFGSYPSGTVLSMKVGIYGFSQLIGAKTYNLIINAPVYHFVLPGPATLHVYPVTMP